jgi:hypothetical protein
MGRQAVGKKLQIVSAHRQAAKESRQEKKKLQIVSTNPPERRLPYYGWHARSLVNNPWRQSLEDHRRLSGANPVVVIITGTGSHSGATGGPVLRSAVENLLQWRQMHFVRNTPGSIRVNPNTGIVFTSNSNSTSKDTKLIVVDNIHDSNGLGGLTRLLSTKKKSITTEQQPSLLHASLQGPSLLEVVKDEADLARSKAESFKLLRQEQKLAHQETTEFHIALDLSKLNHSKNEIQIQQEQKHWQQAIECSREHEEELKQQANVQEEACGAVGHIIHYVRGRKRSRRTRSKKY